MSIKEKTKQFREKVKEKISRLKIPKQKKEKLMKYADQVGIQETEQCYHITLNKLIAEDLYFQCKHCKKIFEVIDVRSWTKKELEAKLKLIKERAL